MFSLLLILILTSDLCAFSPILTFGPNVPTANWYKKNLAIDSVSEFQSRDINFLLPPEQQTGLDGGEEGEGGGGGGAAAGRAKSQRSG